MNPDLRIRKPRPHEMESVYMMGFDAWGDGATVPRYLDRCWGSDNYRGGTWQVLSLGDSIVSSLITYRDLFRLPPGCYGIGSVATDPSHRRRGYASALIRHVVARLEGAGASGVYLFSEVGERLYRDLGFELTDDCRHPNGSLCMVRPFGNAPSLLGFTPEYF